jgi:hypothetical protein
VGEKPGKDLGMRKALLSLILVASVVAGGCVLTLNSLFTSKDAVFDPELAGVWQNPETTWTIKPFDKATGRYAVDAAMQKQPEAKFYATLGTVGKNRFLELTPQRPDAIHAKTFFGGHFLPLHSFWKVGLDGDKLTLTSMSIQWLQSAIEQKKTDIKFEKSDGGIVFLTASTQELQEFVAKYADDRGAFPSEGDEKGITFARGKDIPK